MPKAEILDPQGQAIVGALGRLGLRLETVGIATSVEDSIAQVRQIAALAGHPERGEALVARIEAGYCEQSPKPGIHWLYRCTELAGNTKLATRPKTPEEMKHPKDREQVLIETRGVAEWRSAHHESDTHVQQSRHRPGSVRPSARCAR